MSSQESGATSFVAAPDWLRKKVTDELLGVKYVMEDARDPADDPATGFGCWGFAWYYEKLCGLLLPRDSFEAAKQFAIMIDTDQPRRVKARWRDILVFKPADQIAPHCGVIETPDMVVHCGKLAGGVVRAEIHFPPWNRARLLRHDTLL